MNLLLTFLIFISFIFIMGLCIGSFLNVVILRAFSNESIVLPPSKCPKCQTPLKWYHNIPVLSWIFLKGKCAFCKEKISVQYPIVELVTGFLFVAISIKYQFSLAALFMLVFGALFVVIATTDIKEKVVFDYHTYTLALLGLIFNFFNIGNLYTGQKIIELGHFSYAINFSFIEAIGGLLAGILIMEALARFGYLVAGTRAFGEGDSYIAAGLGAVFGFKYLIIILIYSLIIQIIFTIPVFFKKLYLKKDIVTIVSFCAFFLVAFAFKSLNAFGLLYNIWAFSILLILMCGLGVFVCKRILGGIKDQSDMTYLPFGPAMVISALIVMFVI